MIMFHTQYISQKVKLFDARKNDQDQLWTGDSTFKRRAGRLLHRCVQAGYYNDFCIDFVTWQRLITDMVLLQIEHRVPDCNGWKKVFDSDPVDRKQAV